MMGEGAAWHGMLCSRCIPACLAVSGRLSLPQSMQEGEQTQAARRLAGH